MFSNLDKHRVDGPKAGEYDLLLYCDGQRDMVWPIVVMGGYAHVPPMPSNWYETLVESTSAADVLSRARRVFVYSIEQLEAERILKEQHGVF